MKYVDGYVIPLPKKNLKAYTRMAKQGAAAWLRHGALDYKECVAEDLKPAWGVPFSRSVRLRAGETLIFSYVVFRSRAHRDRVNAKVMREMEKTGPTEMPFDVKRMVYSGFTVIVDVGRAAR